MSQTSDKGRPKQSRTPEPHQLERRTAIKALVGMGLASGLHGCASLPKPATPGGPEQTTGPATPTPTPTAPPVDHEHPAVGDHLAFAFGDREGQPITPEDITLGDPQVFAYPMDANASHVASESRLAQVMLVRLDPSEMTEETAAHAADGIVAYSGICTHTGCEVEDWDEDTNHFVCPCHDSEFDPADNGRVMSGPARRRLAALPLKIENGQLLIAGGFTGRVGGERRGEDFTNP